MLVRNFVLFLGVCAQFDGGQMHGNRRPGRFPPRLNLKTALGLKNRIQERITQYRERTTQSVCYDIVGCFNLPHKNSPLQKVPEDPQVLDTKFHLFTRRMVDITKPEILRYDDNGKSLNESTMDFTKPLKLIAHGYMSRWNEKGSIIMANAYLKLYDCNVILLDWHIGARGPQYPTAAANTELVGRQLGILLVQMVEKGLDARKIHLIGFSLGAHVCGTASESLKAKGYLIGRITGLDAASPLFRNEYLREKYKKLDRSDAKFVDVIHTDSSPFVTDGFGLWEPIGHVDFFPNGGQDQPGCEDVKDSIVVSHFERGLSKQIVCSHIRAFHLFRESLLNLLERQRNKDSCEFTAYDCPGGMPSFERGNCFPRIGKENETIALDPSYRYDIGKFGEEAKGEGVMFFSTKDSGPYCGTQLQASIQLSPKTGPMKGLLQVQLRPSNNPVVFQINCELPNDQNLGIQMNGLAVADYNSLPADLDSIQARLSFFDIEQEERIRKNQTDVSPTIYFDKLAVRDMYGNSWQYCGKDTKMEDKTGQVYGLLNITLSKVAC
nr:pancreatic lipase-related protein 2-like [Leptinotarsa decemlineata]